MLSDRERQALGDVERRTAAEDPAFADVLREGQKHLHTPSGGVEPAVVVPVVLLVVILLLLTGQLTTAVIIGAIAAGVAWIMSARGGKGTDR